MPIVTAVVISHVCYRRYYIAYDLWPYRFCSDFKICAYLEKIFLPLTEPFHDPGIRRWRPFNVYNAAVMNAADYVETESSISTVVDNLLWFGSTESNLVR